MTRWTVEKERITADRDHLQSVIVYPEGVNKEGVKRENRVYSYRRFCLIPEKGDSTPNYTVKQ